MVDLLTLSFLWLLSIHGLLMLLALWTLNFAPEQVKVVSFSLRLPLYTRQCGGVWSGLEHQTLPCLKMIPQD